VDATLTPISGQAPSLTVILTSDKSSPQSAGATIKWTASATDPDGDTLYYRFWMKGPATGNSWTIMQEWSTDNTWTWYTSSADIGDTDISVWIRDGHHKPPGSYDLERIVCEYQIASGTVGAISIHSSPSGAIICLETPVGMFVGPTVKTPHTFTNVPVGTSTITLSLDGYQDWSTNVQVIAGETTNVDATLIPTPTITGFLSVTSSPTGADIAIDGRPIGEKTPHTVPIDPGPHTIILTLAGYPDWTESAQGLAPYEAKTLQ
jgi:hypothetical protein